MKLKDLSSSTTVLAVGAASAMVASLTATISQQFGLSRPYVALGLSILAALVQVSFDADTKRWQKPIFLVFSALVIFHTALGGVANVELTRQSPPALPTLASRADVPVGVESAGSDAPIGLPEDDGATILSVRPDDFDLVSFRVIVEDDPVGGPADRFFDRWGW